MSKRALRIGACLAAIVAMLLLSCARSSPPEIRHVKPPASRPA